MNEVSTILCKYKNGTISFYEKTNRYDGEYVIISNGPDDFYLYTTDEFDKFQKKLYQARQKVDNKKINLLARAIFTRSELVSIRNGKLKLPTRRSSDIYSESFVANVYSTHIRFMSVEKKETLVNEMNIIELAMKIE